MTTEQMDWLDDERAGRIAQGRASTVDGIAESTPEMHTDEEWALIRDEANGIRAWGMSGIPEIMFGDPSDEQLAAAQKRSGGNGVLIIPDGIEPYWVKRVTDAEEHTHHTREARDQCAAGDHQYAKLLDDVAEREKIKATIDTPQGVTTMAEEPIENRLRRAWLNGFKDGVDRASYAATESTGRWDY